MRSILQG